MLRGGGYLEKNTRTFAIPPYAQLLFYFFSREKGLRAVEIDFLKTVFCCSKLEDGPAYLCFGAKKNPNFLDKCWVFDLAQYYTHSTELDMYFNYFKCLPDILWYVIIF